MHVLGEATSAARCAGGVGFSPFATVHECRTPADVGGHSPAASQLARSAMLAGSSSSREVKFDVLSSDSSGSCSPGTPSAVLEHKSAAMFSSRLADDSNAKMRRATHEAAETATVISSAMLPPRQRMDSGGVNQKRITGSHAGVKADLQSRLPPKSSVSAQALFPSINTAISPSVLPRISSRQSSPARAEVPGDGAAPSLIERSLSSPSRQAAAAAASADQHHDLRAFVRHSSRDPSPASLRRSSGAPPVPRPLAPCNIIAAAVAAIASLDQAQDAMLPEASQPSTQPLHRSSTSGMNQTSRHIREPSPSRIESADVMMIQNDAVQPATLMTRRPPRSRQASPLRRSYDSVPLTEPAAGSRHSSSLQLPLAAGRLSRDPSPAAARSPQPPSGEPLRGRASRDASPGHPQRTIHGSRDASPTYSRAAAAWIDFKELPAADKLALHLEKHPRPPQAAKVKARAAAQEWPQAMEIPKLTTKMLIIEAQRNFQFVAEDE